jgi:hypothetical protein
MDLELVLLLMESVLLVVTTTLLVYSIREGHQRNRLMLEVNMATKTLTRLEYFQSVSDAMLEAKNEIIACITGRRPTEEDDLRRLKSILVALDKAVNRGVKVRYLLPKFQDRLYIGFLYTKAGAEVRYTTNSIVTSLRYMVVDNKIVVMGIPVTTGKRTVTRKGHRIPSEALASILTEHFNSHSEQDMSLKEYAQNVLQQTGTSVETMAVEFGLEPKELQTIIGGENRNR